MSPFTKAIEDSRIRASNELKRALGWQKKGENYGREKIPFQNFSRAIFGNENILRRKWHFDA